MSNLTDNVKKLPNGPLAAWLKILTPVLFIPIALWLVRLETRMQRTETAVEMVPEIVRQLQEHESLRWHDGAQIQFDALKDAVDDNRELTLDNRERRDREMGEVLRRLIEIERLVRNRESGS